VGTVRRAPAAPARPVAFAAVEGRQARRKRATEERLLDAALAVFLEHGYDGATTGAMARAADVAAGTFYLHFRDKRAVYDQLARRAAHELITAWRAALRPGRPMGECVQDALRLAAGYWRSNPARAKLLLEGGPSLGSEGHLRLVHDIAGVLAANAVDGAEGRGRTSPQRPARAVERRAHAHALVALGLGIELGRLIVAKPDAEQEVDDLLRLVRGVLPSS
jgi:AcrR family transcriptional regulator